MAIVTLYRRETGTVPVEEYLAELKGKALDRCLTGSMILLCWVTFCAFLSQNPCLPVTGCSRYGRNMTRIYIG